MPLPVVILRSAEHDLVELRGYISKRFGDAIWGATYAKIVETVFAWDMRALLQRRLST